MVRDQALAIAGLLNEKMHGRPVFPPLPKGVWAPFQGGDDWNTPSPGEPDRYRRSVYTYVKRSIPYPILAAFDAPSREFCALRRPRSNTPLQSLVTLNDEVFHEAAVAFGARMKSAGNTPEERIRFGILAATCREPDPSEVDELFELYKRANLLVADEADASSQKNGESDTGIMAEDRALALVASVILNLDEVLCN
jgi:hypothetical protein